MDKFLEEYSSKKAVQKYTKETAGFGISYLLENDYGKIYLEAINKYLPEEIRQKGIRILEFGCGCGMNLIHLVSVLERQGVHVQSAYGTDFSERLIDAAQQEAKRFLSPEQQEKVKFCVARNENLVEDLSRQLGIEQSSLQSSFHLILGVNTFRYCHRLKKEFECARDIHDLLIKDGICVMIDMNNKYPFFRSKIPDLLTKKKEEYYIPSLNEYVRSFEDAKFQVLRKENFCWIPHSARPGLTRIFSTLTPLLNIIARNYAMRSLVISKKTGNNVY